MFMFPVPSTTSSRMNDHRPICPMNFANIVTVKLSLKNKKDSTKYKIWKEQMVCLLESQDLLEFTYAEMQPPNDREWRRRERLVKGCILGSLEEDTLRDVFKLDTARDVWLKLEEIFYQADETQGTDWPPHWKLYREIVGGKPNSAPSRSGSNPVIGDNGNTALHVSVSVGRANDFVRELIGPMTRDALACKNDCGETALHYAAKIGNEDAAKMLVAKNPVLLYITDDSNCLPVHTAVGYCHKDVTEYLIRKSEPQVENSPFEGQLGVRLLIYTLASEFFDVAIYLLEKYPYLAKLRDDDDSALEYLARTSSVYGNGESFSWWQNLIYSCIPLEKSSLETTETSAGDIENNGLDAPQYSQTGRFLITFGWQRALALLWTKVVAHLVPQAKMIARKKLMHQRALEVAELVCQQLETRSKDQRYLAYQDAKDICGPSIIKAAREGNDEIVALIVEKFPSFAFCTDKETGGNIFHMAVRNRHENVFNLIYQMDHIHDYFRDSEDDERNNYMHLCGRLAPAHKLNLVPGAALQMQRELQWFKEMEKFVKPSRRSWRNKDGKTPKMLFTEEHQKLKEAGEKWMKDTATACILAAALIATVVFAAAFTVPGGIQPETGRPIFWGKFSFTLFAISDAGSLFTSVTSLLMFLSILTSRYAEEDFLRVLPKRLCIGLLTLFISITFMMVAFSATLYLVMEEKRYMLAPIAALACFPVASFVLLQFPLLLDVFCSTYLPSIFGPNSKRILY